MKNDHQICSCDQKRSTRALTHMHRIRAIRGHLQTGIKRKFIVINFIRGMNGKLAEVIQMCHTFQHWHTTSMKKENYLNDHNSFGT